MNWIDVDGHSFRYSIEGSDDTASPVVVLIHEAGGSIESWDAVVPGLGDASRILRYDQRGFGMSEKVATLSLDEMVSDLIALLDAVGCNRKVHLVGSAMGGTIALAAAALHPERVASIVTNSPVTGPAPAAARESLLGRAERVRRDGMRAVADAALARAWPLEFRDPQRFDRYRLRYLGNDPFAFAAMSEVFCQVDIAPLYPSIGCPVLILGCTFDVIKTPASCQEIAEALPAGRYEELTACHFVTLQAPESMSRAIHDFITGQSVNV